MIENRWVEGAGSFITRSQLDECIDPDWKPQLMGQQGFRYVAGLDLGLTKDRTALAVGHLDKAGNSVVLDYMRVWQGSMSSPVSIAAVEEELLSVAGRFSLDSIAFDPWQLQASLQRLRSRLPVKEFSFTSESVRRLSETLFNLFQTTQLRLYPDEELQRELLNLNVVQKGYGWRIDHAAGGYSDRAMALGMMAMEALGNRGRPNIRWIYH